MSNKFQCKIINYQRIRSALLEFVPGLNVIVGESNNGKTAILRSLETAIYNIPREDHVTLGEIKSAVGIKYNGHEVIWRRDREKSSQVTYRVDGKIYQKLGRGQPEEVAQALGISELDVSDRKFRLNFSKQMSYPFLLDSTPSDMFKFIAQSSGEENLIDVLKQMKKDLNEIVSSVKTGEDSQKVLGESLVQMEKRYNSIKGNREYCDKVITLELEVKNYQRMVELIESYKKCNIAIDKMNNSLNYHKSRFNEINSNVSILDSKVKSLECVSKSIDSYGISVGQLIEYETESSSKKKYIETLSELDDYIESYKSQESNSLKYQYLSSSIDRYKSHMLLIVNIDKQIVEKKNYESRASKFIESIGKVIEIKNRKAEDLAYLRSSINALNEFKKQISSLRDSLENTMSSYDSIVVEIQNIGVCPYCGSELGGSHEC